MKRLAAAVAVLGILALIGCREDPRVTSIQERNLKKLSLTASELPDGTLDIPGEWSSVTVNGVTVSLPSEPGPAESLDGEAYVARCGDTECKVFFKTDLSDSNETYEMLMNSKEKALKKAFRRMGLEFDGTQRSLYRAMLAVDEGDIAAASKKTRSDISPLGGFLWGSNTAYDIEKGGCELFVFRMEDNYIHDYCTNFFEDGGAETVIYVDCEDNGIALKVAASAKTEQ